MKPRKYTTAALGLIAAFGVGACDGGDGGGIVSPDPVPAEVVSALTTAYQDEALVYYTYASVLQTLGSVEPFVQVAPVQQAHMATVATLFTELGLSVPASQWNLNNVPRYTSLQAACAAGLMAEMEHVLMYDRVLMVELPAKVGQTFRNQRQASLRNHFGPFQQCAGAGDALTASVESAMAEAIQDEYRAFYTYSRVVADLGSVRPFVVIKDAEEAHYSAIGSQYAKRGLAVPASTWTLDNVPRYANLRLACAAGVQGEQDNIAMYDRLLHLDLPADVKQVFTHLRAASLESHLPAFQRCAS